MATREKGSGNRGDIWIVKPHYKKLVQEFEGTVDTGIDLTEKTAEDQKNLLNEAEEILKKNEIKQTEVPF